VRPPYVAIVAGLVVAAGACGGSGGARTFAVHVTGAATSRSTSPCFLLLRSRVERGGSASYCLERFTGAPGANTVVRDSGRMTFALADGTLRARVRVAMRYGSDGKHGRQTLRGTIVGGTGRYADAHGTIAGGGRAVENQPGHIASQDLRYRVKLRGM
jgi:hypothetical protein